MHLHRGEVVVVQARPAELGLVEVEAQRLDQVQAGAGHGREADRVARVAGDAGLEEHEVGERRGRALGVGAEVRSPVLGTGDPGRRCGRGSGGCVVGHGLDSPTVWGTSCQK
ncbi:hypothetical protein D3C74_422310 [compost metagenome]